MTNALFIAAMVVTVFLILGLVHRAGSVRIAALNDARRSTSRLVGMGQLVVGSRRRAVALAVTDATLFYESFTKKASIDLDSILAIEYDTVLAAGVDVREGRVLRLHSRSDTIEFVLPREDISNWYLILPPHPARTRAADVPSRDLMTTLVPASETIEWRRYSRGPVS